jgi:hypothetical protein
MGDGGAVNALVVDDGTNWTCPETRSRKIAVITCPPYNANGDDLLDDSPAITAAIASGMTTVYFPAGTYMIGAVNLMVSNRNFLGAGVGITTLKLMDNTTSAILGAFAPLVNVEVAHMTLDGNKANNPQVSYGLLGIGSSIDTAEVSHIFLHDLRIQNSAEYGIGLEGGEYSDIFINNVTITNTGRDGIDIKLKENKVNKNIFLSNVTVKDFGVDEIEQAGIDIRGEFHMTNIVIEGVTGDDTGIRFNRGTDPGFHASSRRSTLVGFSIYQTSGDVGASRGLWIRHSNIAISQGYISGTSLAVYTEGAAPPVEPSGISVTNVTMEGARSHAYYSTGANDTFVNLMGCQAINGTNGFLIVGDFARVIGNRISGNSAIGLDVGAGSDSALILGNHIASNGTNFANGSVTTKVKDNFGIVTNNSGQATVVSGTTAIAVTHGLYSVPAIKDIAVTLNNDTTNDIIRTWVSTVTSTQFTINVKADPGASHATFAWQASVLN